MDPRKPAFVLVVAAFGSVYLIWGATYLGIKLAIDTLPPFIMAGVRWLLAGGVLYAWSRARGDAAPTLREWKWAAIIGTLLVVGGNGTVTFAQGYVPSGLTALLVAVVPLFVALLEWARTGIRPGAQVTVGVALGLVGVALLVGPAALLAAGGSGWMGAVGMGLVLCAAFSWANGSLLSRRAVKPSSLLLGVAMQMLVGGAILALVGAGVGELSRMDLAAASPVSWGAFAFLVLFGSIVAYTAYVWLLQVVRAQMVATYAFVNPVVAVILGTFFAAEPFTFRTGLVAGIIVVAVALVVTAPAPRAETPPVRPKAAPEA